MEKILTALNKKVLIYDGALGTMLQNEGLLASYMCPEEINLTKPDGLEKVHRMYVDAGADIIETNTFGASSLKLREYGLHDKTKEINKAAVKIARKAAGNKAYVAGSVGPLPKQLEPLGDLNFDQALAIFREQIKALADAGADLIIIETMSDIKEAKAAVIAAKECCKLPVQAQMTFDKGKWTLSGTPPEVAAVVLGACGADIIGANCSSGPEDLLHTMKVIGDHFTGYISVLPNAGLPELVGGNTVYKATPKYMAEYALKFAKIGVNMIGGCCGTSPDHIRAYKKALKNKKPAKRKHLGGLTVASRTKLVRVDDDTLPVVIGERINPTNRKDLSAELSTGKMTLLKSDAVAQAKNGAAILDINVGIPGMDEVSLMKSAVTSLQNTVDVPVSIDTMNVKALEAGLKEYAGKPLINSVNGKKESIKSVLPLAAKYGAALIGLTIDEKGIPKTVDQRINIAKKISREAQKLGIKKEDLLMDTLTLTVSSEPKGAHLTLEAVRKVKALGLKASLGVSNVSFGLPGRKFINSSFLSMAIGEGLDGAIINPNNQQMMDAFLASSVLVNRDKFAARFIEEIRKREADKAGKEFRQRVTEKDIDIKQKLYNAILFGEREEIAELLAEALQKGLKPMDINLNILAPALEEVGKKFESKEYFLPQLMLSAETMRTAFSYMKKNIKEGTGEGVKGKIIIATVEGDVHDIGKNIVIAVLENYGFEIIDLGKNVPAADIISSAKKHKTDIVGLSALMTTTMTEMENVIKELKKQGVKVKTVVGGAVISPAYAKKIGADGYARDAIDAVKVVKDLLGK